MTNTQPQARTTSDTASTTRMGRQSRHHDTILKTLDAVLARAQGLGPAMSASNYQDLRRPCRCGRQH